MVRNSYVCVLFVSSRPINGYHRASVYVQCAVLYYLWNLCAAWLLSPIFEVSMCSRWIVSGWVSRAKAAVLLRMWFPFADQRALGSCTCRMMFKRVGLWYLLTAVLSSSALHNLRCTLLSEYKVAQGRIKVRGGPRLNTVMGPYASFISYHRLRTLRVWGIVPGKIWNCKGPQVSWICRIIRPIYVRMNLQFLPAQRMTVTSSSSFL